MESEPALKSLVGAKKPQLSLSPNFQISFDNFCNDVSGSTWKKNRSGNWSLAWNKCHQECSVSEEGLEDGGAA